MRRYRVEIHRGGDVTIRTEPVIEIALQNAILHAGFFTVEGIAWVVSNLRSLGNTTDETDDEEDLAEEKAFFDLASKIGARISNLILDEIQEFGGNEEDDDDET